MLNNQKNDVVKSESRKNQTEVEVVDLKRALHMAREDKQRMDADITTLKKDLEEERTKSKSLTLQGDRLRAMVENLDQTREQLV